MRTPLRIALFAVLSVLAYGTASAVRTVDASPTPRGARTGASTRTGDSTRTSDSTSTSDSTRTTMDGVYTMAQATKGSDVFAAYCKTCHTPTVHSGPPFRAKWFGRALSDLYSYIRREMPKNEPGSMSDADYARALAYLLRINGMPPGNVPLAADSTALHRIRLDSVRAGSTASDTRP